MLLTQWDGQTSATGAARRELGESLRGDLQRLARRTEPDPQARHTFWRLFTEGDPVRTADVGRVLSDPTLRQAVHIGLLVEVDDYLRSTASILPMSLDGGSAWVACDFAWNDQLTDHVAGPGNATATLARALAPPRTTELAIDIGTGCGALGVHLSGLADRVVVTDLNPRALAYADITAALNGLVLESRLGSYAEPVAAEQAALVIANPPYVLGNPDQAMVFRDTDEAGLSQSLAGVIAPLLRVGGVGQYLGNWLYLRDDTDPLRPVAGAIAATGCAGLVIERAVVDLPSYVDLWVPDRAGPTHAKWVRSLAGQGAVAVGTGIVSLCRIDRTSGAATAQVVRMHEEFAQPLGPAIAEYFADF